jgi:hypothetical protein
LRVLGVQCTSGFAFLSVLAAAIVARTTLTDAQLGKLLRWYRTPRVGDLLTVPEGENVVPFVKHKPGPRKAGAPEHP